MIVTGWEVFKVRVPLDVPYTISRGSVDAFFQVVVLARGADGQYGVGECALYSLVGDWDGAYRSIRSMTESLNGMESLDIEAAIGRMDPHSRTDLAPVAAIELSLWDLNGKEVERPVYQLLGGKLHETIGVDYTLGEGDADVVVNRAIEMTEVGGYRGFCVKVGGGRYSPTEDIDRIRALRAALGPDVSLRLDANAGYDAETTVEVLRAIDDVGIEFIEQPVAPGDYDGLRLIASRTNVPICIDEGLTTLGHAYDLARTGDVKYFNIKIPKCGGLHLARKIASVAEAAGISCVCGGALALEIVRQASRHFACSVYLGEALLRSEGPGPASQQLAGNVTRTVVTHNDVKRLDGTVAVSDVPGLGVDLDWTALRRYES